VAGTAAGGGRQRRLTPYLLSAPALLYLIFFFVVPLWSLVRTSLSGTTGNVYDPTLTFSWEFANFTDAIDAESEELLRSFGYALAATLICLVMAYPLAYFLAFKAGRWKNPLLGLVILPFFITFIVRTLAWKTILQDDSPIVSLLDSVGLFTENGRLLSTSWAVIGGLTYNFLPFMILPIYVSIEKIDPRLLEAARDLYAGGIRTFRKVLLPLSMPGVLAGSLLTFIPATGDFVNAQYLGGTNQTMVGNRIQTLFLRQAEYPQAAALSVVLMLVILVGVVIYTRALGTEDLV
jgi:spermidine/putrescine transport system permease protein